MVNRAASRMAGPWASWRLGALVAAFSAAMGLAAPALACSPAFHTPTSGPQRGTACAVTWRPDEIRSVGLGPARDLGAGFLGQMASDGNGCYSESYAVIMDCTAGQALVIGPENFALMERMENPAPVALEQVLGRIDRAAEQGRLSLAMVEAEAAKAGLATRLSLRARDRMDFNGRRLALDCGCRTFYPGLKPGN